MTSPAPLTERIGSYRVLRLLGEGGMGRVYACHDDDLDREVAVKVLLPEVAKDGDMAARFLREARAMAKLSSPRVVTVFQVGEHDGAPFLVMELLEGEDLARRVQKGALAIDEAVRFVREAADGLKLAGEAGLVHRDVKPANLFATRAGVKLTDFGLARPIDGSQDLTQAGLVVGSPHYLAPELARGCAADLRSDIYALGVTLFELLAARPPFLGATAIEVVSAHITKEPPKLRSLRPDVPAALASVIERMMEKEPAARFGDYDALDAALARAVATTTDEPARASDRAPDRAPTATVVFGTPARAPAPSPAATTSATAHAPSTSATASVPMTSGPLPTVKTQTLTVMFTDIAGYTERTGTQSREEAAHWLALHDALLLPVVKGFGGSVVKTIGDALLVTFKSPTDAVLCGTAIQDRLFHHNRSVADVDRVEVRVALSAGEVRVHKGDVFGEAVNVAARLEKLATPGEVVLSDAVFSTMNAAEVKVVSLGPQELKGIQRPVEVYRAVPDGEPGDPPFGGRALERLEQQGKLNPVVGEALGRGKEAASSFARNLQGGSQRAWASLERTLGRRGRAAAAGAAGLVVAAGLVFALLPARGDGKGSAAASARDDEDDDAREAKAIEQLEDAPSCGQRRQALFVLKRLGKSEEALEAIQGAAQRLPDNLCMALDFMGAEQAVKRRLE